MLQVRAAWHPSEAWLYDRDGNLIDSARVDFAARRLGWTPLASVSPVTRDTLVAAEDRRFFGHGGVDLLALAGVARDKAQGERARGASTITMQLAGYLAPDLAAPGSRRWWDKIRQMRAAWALEGAWTKDQILEGYLNLAGFRGEAQGIAAARTGPVRQDARRARPRRRPVARRAAARSPGRSRTGSRAAPARCRTTRTAPASPARPRRCSARRAASRSTPALRRTLLIACCASLACASGRRSTAASSNWLSPR